MSRVQISRVTSCATPLHSRCGKLFSEEQKIDFWFCNILLVRSENTCIIIDYDGILRSLKSRCGKPFQRSRGVQKAEDEGWHVDLEVLPRPRYKITWLEVYSVLQDHRWSHYSDCTKPDFEITRKLFNTKTLACQLCLSCPTIERSIL